MNYYTYPSLPSLIKQTCGESAVTICSKLSNTLFKTKQYVSGISFAFDLTNKLKECKYFDIANAVSVWNDKLDEIVNNSNNQIKVTYKNCIVT